MSVSSQAGAESTRTTGPNPQPEAPDPARLSLNTATVREQWNLAQMIEACARHGIRGISPWRDKLAELGAAEAARRIRANGLSVSGLCRGGMFPAADAAGRRAAIEDNLRAIDDAATLGARCLVLVVGGVVSGTRDLDGARAMVRDGLVEILPHARASGVPLAIEPLHPMYCADRACVNTLDQALDLCDEIDPVKPGEAASGAIGVAVDAYHVWWDPRLAPALARASAARLLAYHICDWLVPTRDLLLDRGMMGDGVIDLPELRARVEANGYRGAHEVEILSTHWWQRDPDEVLEIVRDRHLRCS
ncbi:MAG TPA: sugar phosphate isomerase/epimerase family protein [Zeimonas sp.]